MKKPKNKQYSWIYISGMNNYKLAFSKYFIQFLFISDFIPPPHLKMTTKC